MRNESENRARDLRSKVSGERDTIADLQGQFKHPSMRPLIQHASYALDDVETQLSLAEQSTTLAAQSMWIASAEFYFHQIAVPQRKQLQVILAQYGGNAMAIPSLPGD